MQQDSIVAKLNKKPGFTLVELMLAMAFVGLLMLAITYCIIQVSTTYSRGLTLRQVNDAGRSISDDMKRAIARSPGSASIQVINVGSTGGRLCTGEYTYVWNNPTGLDAFSSNPISVMNRYNTGTASIDAVPIRLARLLDRNGALCVSPIGPITNTTGAVDLLAGSDNVLSADTTSPNSDRPLALRQLTVQHIPGPAGPSAPVTTNRGLSAWRVDFQLGTSESAALNAAGCRPPSDAGANQTYCAINNFSFTATKSMR